MTQTTGDPQSQILQKGTLLTLKAGFWRKGEVALTTERFTRTIRGSVLIYNTLGALGALINEMLPAKTDIDIPLQAISEIGRGKMGLKKDVLYIGTVDGQSYQLTPNYEAWCAALKSALERQGATLVQSENERWTVQR